MEPGHDWSKPPFHKDEYKTRFFMPFVVTTLCALPVFTAIVLVTQLATGTNVMQFSVLPVSAALAMGLLVAAFTTFTCPVRLTTQELSGVNAYAFRQSISFDDVARVTRPWYGAWAFLIVHSRKSAFKIWLPIYLKEKAKFVDDLSRIVPAGHPLLVAARANMVNTDS